MLSPSKTSNILLLITALLQSASITLATGINCDGDFTAAHPSDFTNLLNLINSADFTTTLPTGGYTPSESIACSGPLCAYYIQHVGPPTLPASSVQPLASLIASHCGDPHNRGIGSQGLIVGASPIQLAPGGDGQNDVNGGEMRIDAGFGGDKKDGLRFPFETINLSTFSFTGCNNLIMATEVKQSAGCVEIGSGFQGIQASLNGNSCNLGIFSDGNCSSRVATVDLSTDGECISQDDISNTFSGGVAAELCCDESCGHY